MFSVSNNYLQFANLTLITLYFTMDIKVKPFLVEQCKSSVNFPLAFALIGVATTFHENIQNPKYDLGINFKLRNTGFKWYLISTYGVVVW